MMLFVIITAFLAIATVFATHTMLRTDTSSPLVNSRTQIYQSQIAEIDREEKNGVIPKDDAEALRAEAQRRLLAAADESENREAEMPISKTTTVLLMTGMIVIGGTSLYAVMGKPNVSSVKPATLDARLQQATGSQDRAVAPAITGVDRMITQLAERLQKEPDDAEGWRMLGWSYYSQNRYQEAANAYKRAVDLEPENANFLSAYGESLIGVNGGKVTQDVENIFDKVLAVNPNEPRARFFKGMALDQAGDTPGALDVWIDMLNAAPASAPWVPDVREQVMERAKSAGIDIIGRLEVSPLTPPSSAAPNPTREDINAAMQMSPQDRQAMVEGMVASLGARLEANPNDPDGWIQLIRSQMVLGQTENAELSLKSAADSFSGNANIRNKIIAEAKLLGVELEQ